MRIEQELKDLRSRHAVMYRGGHRVKTSIWALFVIVVALLAYLFLIDLTVGLFIFLTMSAIAGIWRVTRVGTKFRWIDVAVPAPGYFYSGPSEAEWLERQMAERENQLARLKSARP